jgi:IS5 family transposase
MQTGFFDRQDRLELLERLGDLLPKLERTIDWESFRGIFKKVYAKPTKKVIRNYAVSSAEMHDSQVFEDLIVEHNSSADIWADSAYYTGDRQKALKEASYRSRIDRKGTRSRKLNDREQEANRKRSTV